MSQPFGMSRRISRLAPKNLGNVIYKELIGLTRKTGAQVVCDFEGQTLLDSLEFEPLLVKPNNHELNEDGRAHV